MCLFSVQFLPLLLLRPASLALFSFLLNIHFFSSPSLSTSGSTYHCSDDLAERNTYIRHPQNLNPLEL